MSIKRYYVGDYLGISQDIRVQKMLAKYNDKSVLFVDTVDKINKQYKVQQRVLLLTEHGIYNLKPGKLVFNRRIDISTVGGVSLSTKADNYFIIHVPKEYDYLFICDRKTEFITALSDQYQLALGKPLPLTFKDDLSYKIKKGLEYTLHFSEEKSKDTVTHAVDSKDKKKLNISVGAIEVVGNLDKFKPAQMNTTSKPEKKEWNLTAPQGRQNRGISIGNKRQPPSAPAPPPSKAAPKAELFAKGLYDFKANDARELSFKKNDKLRIIAQDDDGWWSAELDGKLGYVPSTYVELIVDKTRGRGYSRNVPLPAKPK